MQAQLLQQLAAIQQQAEQQKLSQMQTSVKHIPIQPDKPKINSYLLCGTRFDLPVRYTPEKPVGHGAYGVVAYLLPFISLHANKRIRSAKDNVSGERVAIKKISKAFENLKDTKRILREIKLLRHFQHENVSI